MSVKISVKRTGGFAGLSEDVVAVDTADLDAPAAQQAEQMVQGIGFFDLPSTISGGTIGADMFRYEITVTEANRQYAVAFDEDDSPETAPLRRLVDALVNTTR
jgi:hypothetical protein